MKTQIFIWIAMLLPMLAGAQEIEVPETSQPLIVKRTASWCPKCGGYGWTLFRDLLQDQQDNALVLAAHYQGSQYENPVSNELVSTLGGFGQPIFYYNTEDLEASSNNTAEVRQTVAGLVQDFNAQAPAVQTGLLAQVVGDSLEVRTKTRFFSAVDGVPVHLSVYLIEPVFIGSQSGQGSMAEHKNLLRLSLAGGAFGETIAEAGADAGTEVDRSYRIAIADIEAAGVDVAEIGNQSLILASVLWQGSGSDLSVLNTNSTRETLLSAAGEPAWWPGVALFPTATASTATLQLRLPAAVEGLSIQLAHANGQVASQVFEGALPPGGHQFKIAVSQLPAGHYFVQIRDGQHQACRRLIVTP